MKIVILNNCALHSRYFRNAVNIRHTEPGYGYRGFVHGIPAGLRMMEREWLPVIRETTACVYFGQEKDIRIIVFRGERGGRRRCLTMENIGMQQRIWKSVDLRLIIS